MNLEILGILHGLHGRADLIERAGVLQRGQIARVAALGNRADAAAEDLPDRVFGSAVRK